MDNYDDYPAGDPIPEPSEFYGELIQFLTESRGMRQTAKSSLKQSLYAGGGALAGGVLLGPVGGLVGGVAGSVVGFLKSDNYDGIILHLSKLETQQQRFLIAEVGKILTTAGARTEQLQSTETFRNTIYTYAEKDSVRNEIWKACLNAVSS